MPDPTLIPPRESLLRLRNSEAVRIDVRSEGEYAKGFLPGFASLPILRDDERREVGITYKQHGPSQATRLGYALVAPDQERRIHAWKERAAARPALVACWRGGLRSQIAAQWMADAGMEVLRVEGGYKALRAELLPRFADPGELRVLAGYTGSGKTALLRALPSEWSIDLEAMARHRGSSFGDLFDEPQPRQATFENTLGLKLYHERHPHLIEDESLRIGSVSLPIELKRRMVLAPMILVEASVEARADRIFAEYVALPRRNGIARGRVHGHLRGSIEALERRLGGARATEIRAHLDRVFGDPALDTEPLAHREWIAPLLTHYYDKFYRHTIEDRERKIAFRGTWEECREWIGEKFG